MSAVEKTEEQPAWELVDDFDGPELDELLDCSPEEQEYWYTRWKWRVARLYTVVNKWGRVVPFRPNRAQRMFMNGIHGTDIILKARQLGFSTLIELIFLDVCLWYPNMSCGVMTITEPDGIKLLQEKVRLVYERMPEELRERFPLEEGENHKTLIKWANGSSITVGTSLRGGTYQFLHISELGKIAAKFPHRAKEIKSGAFNTVATGNYIFVESTAEGQEGLFYDICMEARDRELQGIEPEEGEFKMHFFPWDEDPSYRINTQRPLQKRTKTYFTALSRHTGKVYTLQQMHWYQRKWGQQKHEMKREYPSFPEEAFEASVEGAIYREETQRVYEQQRMGFFPYEPHLGAVYTFWDIGLNDYTVIWLAQRVSLNRWRFFECIYGQSKGLPHYLQELQRKQVELNFVWGTHVLPHDGNNKEWLTGQKRAEVIESSLVSFVKVVPRAKAVNPELEFVKTFIETSEFNANSGAGDGFKHLTNYKWRHDERLGVWLKVPDHNTASHFADAFRTAAMCHVLDLLDNDEYGETVHEAQAEESDNSAGY